MWMWWAGLTMRSRIDLATTGFGNSEYQSEACRFAVKIAGVAPRSRVSLGSISFTLHSGRTHVYPNPTHAACASSRFGIHFCLSQSVRPPAGCCAIPIEDRLVKVAPHPVDWENMFDFHPLTRALIQEYDLYAPDVFAIYPARMDRGKQPEKLMRLFAALKSPSSTSFYQAASWHAPPAAAHPPAAATATPTVATARPFLDPQSRHQNGHPHPHSRPGRTLPGLVRQHPPAPFSRRRAPSPLRPSHNEAEGWEHTTNRRPEPTSNTVQRTRPQRGSEPREST
jgi:hypothetical protein